MKHIYLALTAICLNAFTTKAQTVDTIAQINPGNNVTDVVRKGAFLFATAGNNIYRSADNGATWTSTTPVPDFLAMTEKPMHMLVTSDNNLYVAVTSFVGASGWQAGVMRSSDDGATWTTLGALPGMAGHDETSGMIELAGGKLFLKTNASGGKAYFSTLSSSSWSQCASYQSIYGMTAYNDTLVVSGSGIYYSLDQGNSWLTYPTGPANHMQMWGSVFFAETSTHRFGAYYQSVARANVNSNVFTDLPASVPSGTPSFYPKQILADGNDDLFMTYGDAAGDCFLSKSTDDGQNWTNLMTVASTACFTKMIVSGNDIIATIGEYIVRISNVATPVSSIGIEELSAKKMQINAYPNPVSGIVNFNLPASEKANTIEVYNIGMQLQQVNFTGNSADVSSLSAGVYFAKIICNDQIYHSKFIVNK